MAEETGWTKAQRMAAGFSWSAASKGLSQAAGLAEYRAGLCEIRTADWNELFRGAFAIVGWREDIRSVPLHWAIPEKMFEQRDIDWTSKYNFVAKIEYYDVESKSWQERYLQSGFDEPVTHGEFREDALRRWLSAADTPRADWEKGVHWITEETLVRRWP